MATGGKAEYACGLVQAPNVPASSLHSKELPASDAVKLKLAAALFVTTAGVLVSVVSGAVESTVHVKLAGDGSTLLAPSMARTWKVWLPAARLEYVFGLEQAANPPPSS